MKTQTPRNNNTNARTTPAMRAAIAASDESVLVLARRYGVSVPTIYKWRQRTDFEDRPHTAHRLQTTLTPAQEAVAVELRRTLLLPLDDLLTIIRTFLCPDVSRPGLHRCLKRHGLSRLHDLLPPELAGGARDCEPGHVLLDVKPLGALAEATPRCHLYVAVDQATRWVFARVRPGRNATSTRGFLRALDQVSPMHIRHVRTGNGDAFEGPLPAPATPAPGHDARFDALCAALGIPAASPAPQPAGAAAQRAGHRLAEVLCTDRVVSGLDLCQAVDRCTRLYNHGLPQAALQSRTPVEVLKDWYLREPALFRKRPRTLRGPVLGLPD